MDRNYYTDDFERLLREKSDEFRMYPSKRIWHSIYNNIHPGRKWPSVAMSITLITALLLMGYLNTKNAESYKVTGKSMMRQNVVTPVKYQPFVLQSLAINQRADVNQPGEAVTRDKTSASANDTKSTGAGNQQVARLITTAVPSNTVLAPAGNAIFQDKLVDSYTILQETAQFLNKSNNSSPVLIAQTLPENNSIATTGDNVHASFSTSSQVQKIAANDILENITLKHINIDEVNNATKVIAAAQAQRNLAVEKNKASEKNKAAENNKQLLTDEDRNLD